MTYKIYTLDNEFIKEVLTTDNILNNFTGFIKYSSLKSSYWFEEWYFKGKIHRLDGPAVEYSNGSKYWYIEGKPVTAEQCKFLRDIMKLKGLHYN